MAPSEEHCALCRDRTTGHYHSDMAYTQATPILGGITTTTYETTGDSLALTTDSLQRTYDLLRAQVRQPMDRVAVHGGYAVFGGRTVAAEDSGNAMELHKRGLRLENGKLVKII